ncbi:putative CENPB DNA-binding domain-containing protein 1 [Palaemon carinicauda]|uniref:putative CENPB DNA-binding domain-containing protein 1 n=1 Tax=Palaemon carinicauda TaxID=392227 RepID=UPI0035B66180
MGPEKLSFTSGSGSGEKRKKEMLSLEVKQEIIEKHEHGVRVSELAKEYGRNMSTISTILKQKVAIKAVNASKGITIISKRRSLIVEEMERVLQIWFKDIENVGDTITENIICEKSMDLEVNADDITELVAEHRNELTREELKELHAMSEHMRDDEEGIKEKRRLYQDSYLDYEFTYLVKDGAHIPQCAVCFKTFSNGIMKPFQMRQPLANAHPQLKDKNRSFLG